MKSFAGMLLLAAMSMAGIAGCSGNSSDEKPKSQTEPYREVGNPRTPPPQGSKDAPKHGFQ